MAHFRIIPKSSRLVNPLPPSDAVRQQKKNILEDLSSSILSQFKNITPLETWNLIIWHFPKLKIAYLNRENPFNFSKAEFHSKYFGLFWVNIRMRSPFVEGIYFYGTLSKIEWNLAESTAMLLTGTRGLLVRTTPRARRPPPSPRRRRRPINARHSH